MYNMRAEAVNFVYIMYIVVKNSPMTICKYVYYIEITLDYYYIRLPSKVCPFAKPDTNSVFIVKCIAT